MKHKTAYTAQEVAGAQGVSGDQLAKTVIVKYGKEYAIVCLPASYLVDFKKLKDILGKSVSLAKETEIKKLLPKGIKVGSQPPFGELYNLPPHQKFGVEGLPVYVDKSLTGFDEIVVMGGTYTDTIKIKYADFEKLVKPKVKSFAVHS
jgi:Ala-tRNA(Pro) deacylase